MCSSDLKKKLVLAFAFSRVDVVLLYEQQVLFMFGCYTSLYQSWVGGLGGGDWYWNCCGCLSICPCSRDGQCFLSFFSQLFFTLLRKAVTFSMHF